MAFLVASAVTPSHRACAQVPTTLLDFHQKGTQPDADPSTFEPMISANVCRLCHEFYLSPTEEYPVYSRWQASIKANAARDPLFRAALTIANQDADFAGDLCIRCHSPGGWLAGRSTPTDGSALTELDMEGVSCHFCHRLIDPVLDPNHTTPPEGDDILRVALRNAGLLPIRPGGGTYVVDPQDVRRGPYPFVQDGPPPAVPANYHTIPKYAPIIHSPFHSESALCGTCHDVSNPVFTKQADGSYAPNDLDTPHPTGDPADMFPVERTYSEWLNSDYANGGVDARGVFGGNHPTGIMQTCQDCHMPDTQSFGCNFDFDPFYERPDMPAHDFNGGNVWMLDVLANMFGNILESEYIADGRNRALYMLQNAATMDVTYQGCSIGVRITNETGHKLPTGYPEGRRMWIEVEFRDDADKPVTQFGAYDDSTAGLITSNTKVYEAVLGLDATMAKLTGIPEGASFHFALNNQYYKDNRIPPRGFTNAAFADAGAAPIGATYADGQYWDDTMFFIPQGATHAVVSLYYQTASREYIEFLRDENNTDDHGDVVYQQWEQTGKSKPVLMARTYIYDLIAGRSGDATCNGIVDLPDVALFSQCLSGPTRTLRLGCEMFDVDFDGDVDVSDWQTIQSVFNSTGG